MQDIPELLGEYFDIKLAYQYQVSWVLADAAPKRNE